MVAIWTHLALSKTRQKAHLGTLSLIDSLIVPDRPERVDEGVV